ncbi:MAG: SDR family NAD(P)-dependent oxidoreductase [Candidatus Omnitrophota bacterium]|jgi:NAD(P)-dependent dehydrogenase (short-subunit alcohol dehydrogenase family)
MGRLEGKVSIITGAASGIGEAAAVLFAQEGCTVIAADIAVEQGGRVSGAIKGNGGACEFIEHDAANEDSWKELVAETMNRYGRLDILVNSAGIGFAKAIVDMSYDEWQKVMKVNLDSVFLGLKYCVGAIRKNGRGGAIINVSSAAAIVAVPGASAYCASKAGMLFLTKSAALESAAAKDGIRINSVLPGSVDTPLWKKSNWWREFSQSHGGDDKAMEFMAGGLPLKRMAKPEEIASGILYLASEESTYVTGTELVIDGGYSAR